jgi:RNA polymerase sigma-70 factor (ECF subfamily)
MTLAFFPVVTSGERPAPVHWLGVRHTLKLHVRSRGRRTGDEIDLSGNQGRGSVTLTPSTPSMPPQDPEPARWFASEVLPHEAALRAYLRSQFSSLTDPDDVVQETYARLLRARERAPIESPRGLLFATARNAARDLLRRRAVAQTFPITETDESRVFDDAPAVPETVSRRQETDLLAAAIAELPPRCREILVLRKFENLSHREIARRLGIAEHTVEAQLTKALRRCEDFFDRHGLPTK